LPTPRLSICIPTHNFGEFIGQALDSVRRQYRPGVEVVILDGGSTDNTVQVVSAYQQQCPYIHFERQASKGGIDADMDRSVRLASGEYCWLLSADDALADGALDRIESEIGTGADVYLCERILCDKGLEPGARQSWLYGPPRRRDIPLDDAKALAAYFADAASIGAVFSYMSSIIVKRASWLRVDPRPSVMGTNYAHVFRLFAMRGFGARMAYIPEALVLCRTGNDSFLSEGVIRRHVIDLQGYEVIAHSLFSDQPGLKQAFKSIVNREHHWVTWVWLASMAKTPDWQRIRRLLRGYGYGGLTLAAFRGLARLPGGVKAAHALRICSNALLSGLGMARK